MKLSLIKSNANNPRIIKDEKFMKLCQSISDFPKMMELRPIIVDENNQVLGGNMRLKALKHLGYKEISDSWVKKASELTDEQKKEFIVKDNVGFGEWNFDILSNEWDSEKLTNWGLDLPTQSLIDEFEPGDPRLAASIAYEGSNDSIEIAGGVRYPISFDKSVTNTYCTKYECSAAEFKDVGGPWHSAPINTKYMR